MFLKQMIYFSDASAKEASTAIPSTGVTKIPFTTLNVSNERLTSSRHVDAEVQTAPAQIIPTTVDILSSFTEIHREMSSLVTTRERFYNASMITHSA